MKQITVVDARMGRGKSSAAIQYMNDFKGKNFLYITPYLAEVERVCEACGFAEPLCEFRSKSVVLKEMLKAGKSTATTHALFLAMDKDSLAAAKERGYSLIIDESIQVIESIKASRKDKELLLNNMVEKADDGSLSWRDTDYKGAFEKFKKIITKDRLYYRSDTLYWVVSPERFSVFNEVYLMTYLFGGQVQKAYFDYFGFETVIVGVEREGLKFRFSEKPDEPPPEDLSGLIHLYGGAKENHVGDNRTALSKAWFQRRSRLHPDIKELKRNLNTFYNKHARSTAKTRLWTTFKAYQGWLLGDNNRYKTSFVFLNARATNTYRHTNCVAYLLNRYADPNITRFFSSAGIEIDQEIFALSEMLQFIWRSAIRDGKEIYLYIPSKRMRKLFVDWVKSVGTNEFNEGG